MVFHIESGYHHVDKFLEFAWPFIDRIRYFSFSVLRFGLRSARFCFTKLLRPSDKRWRSIGHNIFVYLNDGSWGQPDRVSTAAASLTHHKDLKSCGFKIDAPKSHLEPMQVGKWFGFITDTIRMEFHILSKRLNKLK